MAKVIKLFNEAESKQEKVVAHLELLLEMARSGDVDSMLVSLQNSHGDVMTGYCNLDIGERQYMLSHVQVDINQDIAIACGV